MYGKSVVNVFEGSFVNFFAYYLYWISEPSYFQPKKPFLNVKI